MTHAMGVCVCGCVHCSCVPLAQFCEFGSKLNGIKLQIYVDANVQAHRMRTDVAGNDGNDDNDDDERTTFIIYSTHRNIVGHFVYRDEYLVNSPHEVLNDKFFI